MRKRTREAASPEITPLIDVVFLLLIFFMVSTVFKKDELALLLNLPKAASGEKAQAAKENFYIELTENQVAVNGKKLSLEEIDTPLQGIKDKAMAIDLRIDKTVRYERVVQLLDTLKKHKLSNISLITDN